MARGKNQAEDGLVTFSLGIHRMPSPRERARARARCNARASQQDCNRPRPDFPPRAVSTQLYAYGTKRLEGNHGQAVLLLDLVIEAENFFGLFINIPMNFSASNQPTEISCQPLRAEICKQTSLIYRLVGKNQAEDGLVTVRPVCR
jgi:hypothetical protein